METDSMVFAKQSLTISGIDLSRGHSEFEEKLFALFSLPGYLMERKAEIHFSLTTVLGASINSAFFNILMIKQKLIKRFTA